MRIFRIIEARWVVAAYTDRDWVSNDLTYLTLTFKNGSEATVSHSMFVILTNWYHRHDDHKLGTKR